MELHQLRYLRAVVRLGSVTAAAEAEHIAQPSVSKQIRLLERELGTPLFHRVGRRVLPTEAAIEFANCADRVLDDLASTTSLVAASARGDEGSVRICATETAANHLLPAALTRLVREFPKARVRVEMLGTDDVVASVLADEFDLGIAVLPLVDSRLEVHRLLVEDVVVALPRGHRWCEEAAVALAELLVTPELLLSMPGHGLRAQVDEAAQALRVEVAGRIELRSQQALLAMVAAGGGVALAPAMSVAGRADVVARPLQPPLEREVGWLRRKGRHLAPVARRLLELAAG
jgi:DNA-binding transcriptional LysR family regulator